MEKEQLIYVLKGKEDNELGRRFIEIESANERGFQVVKITPLSTDNNGVTTVLFLLEKNCNCVD